MDGDVIRPDSVRADTYRFLIPAGSAAVWLASRSSVPSEIAAGEFDVRRLRVAVERLVLHDGDLVIEAWHGHAALAEGFHEPEATHRWTDGRARLPDSWLWLFPGGCELELHLAGQWLPYRLPPPTHTRAVAAA